MKILFITHGGKGIGLGHVRRCLSIAYEARRQKLGQISFSISKDETAKKMVIEAGFSIQSIHKPDVAIFDTRDDVSNHINQLKSQRVKTVLLDNITPARLASDVVVYPVAHYGKLDWNGFVGEKYIGAKYFPLGQQFKRVRSHSKILRCLVTFGGVDPNNITAKVVHALEELKDDFKIIIALGRSYEGSIPKIDPRFEIKKGEDNSKLMQDAEIAFTAFGTSLYELAFMGIPAIIIYNYEEDKNDVKSFVKCGTSISLGHYKKVTHDDIKNSFLSLIRNHDRLRLMSANGKKLVDDKGTSRICQVIKKLHH